MKKIIFALGIALFSLNASAQVIFNGLLNGYSVGNQLEKGVYKTREDAPVANTWMGVFTSKPNAFPSPVTGKELNYKGYPEAGVSISVGSPAEGARGKRYSIYTLTEGKELSRGVFYLSCLMDFSKIGAGDMYDLVILSAKPSQVSGRSTISICRAPENQFYFGTSLAKLRVKNPKAFALNTTHLVILKLDYKKQTVSMFVDPDLSAGEPADADCIVTADGENGLRHAIRSIAFRNSSNYTGSVGNFRFSKNWNGVISE